MLEMLIMSIASIGFVLGFVRIAASSRIMNRRRAVHRLAQVTVWSFAVGMIYIDSISGMWAMIAVSLVIWVAYQQLFRHRGTGLGVERGAVPSIRYRFMSPSPAMRVSNDTLLRAHADLEVSPLTDREQELFAEIEAGLLRAS